MEWLEGLSDRAARAKARTAIDRLRLGNLSDCKSVGEGVHELRINFGPGYRIYFGSVGNEIILLLNAGSKRKQDSGIELAKQYWAEYKAARAKGKRKEK